MKIFGSVLFALLVIQTIEGYSQNRNYEPDIPQRCLDNPAPSVSCDNVSEDSLLPHPGDCELFLYCVNGESKPICRQCPAKLHFNPTKHVCDLPADAGCSINSIANMKPATNTDDDSAQPSDDPTFSVKCYLQ